MHDVRLSFLVFVTLAFLSLNQISSSAAPAEEPIAAARLVVGGQGFFPVAQRLRDGRIAVVLRGGATHVGIRGRLDIAFSEDHGHTWTKPTTVVDSPLDDRNPAFGQAADASLVVGFWRAAKDTFQDYNTDDPAKPVSTWVTRSTDGGKVWSAPTEIDVRDIGYGSPYGKILLQPDQSLLMNVYGFGVRPPGEKLESKTDYSYLYRSTDHGCTWKRVATIGTNFNETSLLRLPNGSLLAAMRSGGGQAKIFTTLSRDEGHTWSTPTLVTQPMSHPADLILLDDNRVLMTVGYRVPPYGVRGLVGDERGAFDWEKRFVLVNDSTNVDTGYPSSVVLADRRTLTVYYAVGSKKHPDWGVHCGLVDYQISAADSK